MGRPAQTLQASHGRWEGEGRDRSTGGTRAGGTLRGTLTSKQAPPVTSRLEPAWQAGQHQQSSSQGRHHPSWCPHGALISCQMLAKWGRTPFSWKYHLNKASSTSRASWSVAPSSHRRLVVGSHCSPPGQWAGGKMALVGHAAWRFGEAAVLSRLLPCLQCVLQRRWVRSRWPATLATTATSPCVTTGLCCNLFILRLTCCQAASLLVD